MSEWLNDEHRRRSAAQTVPYPHNQMDVEPDTPPPHPPSTHSVRNRFVLGNLPPPRCSVVDSQGHHCPREPVNMVAHRGGTRRLCDLCYKTWKAGGYGDIDDLSKDKTEE